MKTKALIILLTALLIPVASIAKEDKAVAPITAYTAEVFSYTATTGTTLTIFYDLTKPYLLHSAEVRLVSRTAECEVSLQLYTNEGYTTLATSVWRSDGDTSPLRVDFLQPVLIPESHTFALLIQPASGESCRVTLNAIASAP